MDIYSIIIHGNRCHHLEKKRGRYEDRGMPVFRAVVPNFGCALESLRIFLKITLITLSIPTFIQYLLSAYYVVGSSLGIREQNKILVLKGLLCLWGENDSKKDK